MCERVQFFKMDYFWWEKIKNDQATIFFFVITWDGITHSSISMRLFSFAKHLFSPEKHCFCEQVQSFSGDRNTFAKECRRFVRECKSFAREHKSFEIWYHIFFHHHSPCSFQLWFLFINYKLKHILIILGTLRLLPIYPRWLQDPERGKQILHKISILWLVLY